MRVFCCGALAAAATLAVCAEVVAAAVIDARDKRFPNALAVLFALTCAVHALIRWGWRSLASHAFAASACCAGLFIVESAWRRVHGGRPGLGGGDIKFLCGFMLLDPTFAIASFFSGLVLLAVFGVLARRPALPLLPFVAVGAAVVLILSTPATI